MKPLLKNYTVLPVSLLLATLAISGCTNTPMPTNDQGTADSQRSRSTQAQDELSTETAK